MMKETGSWFIESLQARITDAVMKNAHIIIEIRR